MLGACERALDKLEKRESVAFVTPKHVKDFFTCWANIDFVDAHVLEETARRHETDVAAVANDYATGYYSSISNIVHLVTNYDPAISATVSIEIMMNADGDVFGQSFILYASKDKMASDASARLAQAVGYELGVRVDQSERTKLDGETLATELADADISAGVLAHFRDPDFDPLSPESRAMAEEMLSSRNRVCKVCGVPTRQRCGGCKMVYYCGKPCARTDWRAKHKQRCAATALIGRMLEQSALGL